MPITPRIPAFNPSFLSLDGLDGSGKSTQCRRLAEWLRSEGFTVTECFDPGGTPVGGVIRTLLLNHGHEIALPCEALLFMASRAQLINDVIGPKIAEGQIVIADRFTLANVVYQGHAGGLEPADLWAIGRFATGGLEPRLTIVLDLPVELAMTRRKGPADRMESRDVEFHTRVRFGFLEEARRCPERMRVVDASQPPDAVHDQIRREVRHVLEPNSRP